MIERIRNWLTTEGPGHSNAPRKDIAAHRSQAWLIRYIGYAIMALFLLPYFYPSMNPETNYLAGIAVIFLVTQWASQGLRLQALEWETELLTEGSKNER